MVDELSLSFFIIFRGKNKSRPVIIHHLSTAAPTFFGCRLFTLYIIHDAFHAPFVGQRKMSRRSLLAKKIQLDSIPPIGKGRKVSLRQSVSHAGIYRKPHEHE